MPMPLTQAQSIENIVLDGFPVHGGEQLYMTDGFGTGTPGGSTNCTATTLAYDTGQRITITSEIDFTVGDNEALATGYPPCKPSQYDAGARYSDTVALQWGPWKMTAGYSGASASGWLGGSSAGP